jgi:hypothetical protein
MQVREAAELTFPVDEIGMTLFASWTEYHHEGDG